jgi:YidC/Oxa1 family membrane protein insertase
MSRPQNDTKASLMQNLLLMAVVFLGFQLWQQSQGGGFNKAADTRTATDVYRGLQKLNADAMDLQAEKEFHVWEGKFKAESEKQKLPAAQVDGAILKARVLVADTKMKSALYNTGFAHAKLGKAYDLLKQNYEHDKDTSAWSEKVDVAADPKDATTSISASEMYHKIVERLSAQNKTELVWGFVPGYQVIDFLVSATGRQPWISYAFAGFLLALCVRGAVWPLSQKQYIWGRKMQQLQPMLKELEASYKDKDGHVTDQAAYQQAAMKLYGEYGLNPFSGCMPAMVQLPFFFTVFQCMQMYKFEFTKGYFLWINPAATKFLGIPLAPNLGERDIILVVVYGITMVITTMLTPVSDPTQQRQQRIMGLVFAVGVAISMFFYPLPSAFILYWIFTNILATSQSLLVNRMKMPPLEKVATPTGGLFPTAMNGLMGAAESAAGSNGTASVSPDFFSKTNSSKANKQKKSPTKKPGSSKESNAVQAESNLPGWLQSLLGRKDTEKKN